MAGKGLAQVMVEVLGDASGATAALKQTEQATKNAQDVTSKSGKKMAGVWAGVATAMAACVKQASALEAATKGVQVIFEDQADVMMDWAATMSQFGLSTAEAGAAAAILGAQMKNAGATTEQMTVIVQGLIETAAILAQTLGGSATDAVMAMGAAMRGEYDSLERYGITLTADAVATEAARLASEGFTAASEQQAKIVATLSLIQQQATVIMAGAEEQTVTFKSATEHLMASIKNLAAEIGGPLLAALAPMIETVADAIDKFVTWWNESENLQAVLEALADILQVIADILSAVFIPFLERAIDVLEKLGDLIDRYVVPVLERLAEALGVVADALDTVIGWVESAIDAFDRFIGKVHEAIDSLTFWNDTYQASAPLAFAPPPAMPAARGRAAAGTHGTTSSGPTITVYGVTNPQVAARELATLIAGATVRTGWQGVHT